MSGKHSVERNKRIERVQTSREPKKKRRGLKIFGTIVLILVVLIVAILSATYLYINDKFSKMQQVDINEEELDISETAEKNLADYRNIALFGVDSRDSNLGKGNRSDTIIIASINNKTGEVKLISVFRDTYMQIEGHGLDKVTHAYSYGSAALAMSTLNSNMDLNIKEFVTVNFDSVAEAINALGGVSINVDKAEIEYINSYIDETSKVTGITSKHVTSAGKQTLDGVQAVAYARIRYTSGGDYKRAERARDVVIAAVEKLKTKSIGEINALADEILPKIYTNIDISDMLSMLPNLMNYKITDSIGWPYETKGITLDRWYGIPVTLESNVTKLHQEVFNETDYVPSDKVKNVSNQIVTKTGYR